MKKTFRLFTVALVIFMFATLVGCGADYSDKFVIGGIGPTTGTAASYGQSVRDGAQIAVDEINAAGGVNGVELVLLFEDDEALGDKAKSAYETLMDNGMQVLIGAVTSDASIAINSLTAADGILQITPSASAIEAAANPNTFRVCFTDPLQGVTTYAYDAVGNLTGSIDAEGAATAYTYDAIDRLIQFTDGRGNNTTYEYD